MVHNQVVLDLQLACKNIYGLPTYATFKLWLNNIFSVCNKDIELTIRIVDTKEMCYLNWYYLGKNCPTNVLSFPFIPPLGIKSSLLGDIVICRQVIEYESQQRNVLSFAHWAHMIIHGSLHLLGYNHSCNDNAILMQHIEFNMIQQCGFKLCCATTYPYN